MNGQPINDQTWTGILTEFTLPALAQVQRRLSELTEDPEPVMRQLIRVFIDEGTFCAGFQFLLGGHLHPTVTALFRRAMEMGVPHNYYTLWMVTPPKELAGSRPVDHLQANPASLFRALESYRRR